MAAADLKIEEAENIPLNKLLVLFSNIFLD